MRRGIRYRRRRRIALLVVIVIAIGVAVAVVSAFRGADTRGAQVIHFTIHSELTHRTLTETAVIPAGTTTGRRPLLVFLHGKGEDENSNLNDAMFAALANLGSRAPDIVFPDGGEDSYWHDRGDGAWGSYVMHEVIPRAIRLLHANPRRVAIGGLSMGGFGAYDLALLHPGNFCAVGGDSVALWLNGGESAAGAFDDGEDFTRNNVIGMAEAGADPYAGVRLWLDVGSEDPFRSADTTLVRTLRSKGLSVSFHVWPGGHEQSYWQSHWGSYLSFYADALARCR